MDLGSHKNVQAEFYGQRLFLSLLRCSKWTLKGQVAEVAELCLHGQTHTTSLHHYSSLQSDWPHCMPILCTSARKILVALHISNLESPFLLEKEHNLRCGCVTPLRMGFPCKWFQSLLWLESMGWRNNLQVAAFERQTRRDNEINEWIFSDSFNLFQIVFVGWWWYSDLDWDHSTDVGGVTHTGLLSH